MKWLVTLMVVWGLKAQAAESKCGEEYRKAYIELGRTNDERYREAGEIYAVYFDYIHGLTVVQDDDQRRMLESLRQSMESGSLCTYFGYTKNKTQILEQLLAELRR